MTAPSIRLARIGEARGLSELCVRSKASWGYDEAFMALARVVLEVSPKQIEAGDVWVAISSDGEVAGMVALGPSEEPDTLDLDKLFVEPQPPRYTILGADSGVPTSVAELRMSASKAVPCSMI